MAEFTNEQIDEAKVEAGEIQTAADEIEHIFPEKDFSHAEIVCILISALSTSEKERDALAARGTEHELLREARDSLKAIGDLYSGAQSGYIPGANGWEEYERTHHPTEAMLSLQKTIARIDAFLGEKKEAKA
jgi:hypothetical protein